MVVSATVFQDRPGGLPTPLLMATTAAVNPLICSATVVFHSAALKLSGLAELLIPPSSPLNIPTVSPLDRPKCSKVNSLHRHLPICESLQSPDAIPNLHSTLSQIARMHSPRVYGTRIVRPGTRTYTCCRREQFPPLRAAMRQEKLSGNWFLGQGISRFPDSRCSI